MIKNEKTKSVLPPPQTGFWGMIERMRRERERRWVLRMLQKRTLETAIEKKIIINFGGRHFHLKYDPLARYNGEKGFLHWVAMISLSRIRWMDFKGWWYLFRLKIAKDKEGLYEKYFSEMFDFYKGLIDQCISDSAFILQIDNLGKILKIDDLGNIIQNDNKGKNDGLGYIHTSPNGDSFVSQFWYKATLGHQIIAPIITTLIISAIVGLASLWLKSTWIPPENKIQQIQIIPYEQQNGTIIKQK